jgi:hypothetical protein
MEDIMQEKRIVASYTHPPSLVDQFRKKYAPSFRSRRVNELIARDLGVPVPKPPKRGAPSRKKRDGVDPMM